MHSIRPLPLRALLLLVMGLAASHPALAHHPMGGTVPATFWQGLLSGIGHPVIEPDHLLFLLGAAVAVAVARVPARRAALLLPAYALAGAAGTAVHAPGFEIPWAELGIAASLLGIAAALWLQRLPGLMLAVACALAAGFVHGYAYGEAVIGAETTPLLAYLAGLALIQTGLLAAVWLGARQLSLKVPQKVRFASHALGVLMAAFAVWFGAGVLA
jgi:urease accessory protein